MYFVSKTLTESTGHLKLADKLVLRLGLVTNLVTHMDLDLLRFLGISMMMMLSAASSSPLGSSASPLTATFVAPPEAPRAPVSLPAA